MDITTLAIVTVLIFIGLLILKPTNPKDQEHKYELKKRLMSNAETNFYQVLKIAIKEDYEIFCKVRIADVIQPIKNQNKKQWQSSFNKISSKHFDYILCDKKTLTIKKAIELDDKSHNSRKTKRRDNFVNKAAETAGMELIRVKAQRQYSVEEIRKAIIG